MNGKVTVSYRWTCQAPECGQTGTTFASGERHAEQARHTVIWVGVPS